MKSICKPKKTSSAIRFSFFLLIVFFSKYSIAQTAVTITVSGDTTYIRDLVKFYQSRCGNILKGDLYNNTAVLDSPYVYVYVSSRTKVQNSLKNVGYFLFCKHDLKKAHDYDSVYSNVNDCFVYTTAANASTRLSNELLTYRKETQAFIVFHELTHVLLSVMKSKITYTVSEAVCDVVANYLTREYAVANKTVVNLRTVEAQIISNEMIYNNINNAINRINGDPKQKEPATLFLTRELKRILAKGDAFQKRRFDYPVNNAYLLKNSFYSENYYDYKQKLVMNKTLPPDLRDIVKGER